MPKYRSSGSEPYWGTNDTMRGASNQDGPFARVHKYHIANSRSCVIPAGKGTVTLEEWKAQQEKRDENGQ